MIFSHLEIMSVHVANADVVVVVISFELLQRPPLKECIIIIFPCDFLFSFSLCDCPRNLDRRTSKERTSRNLITTYRSSIVLPEGLKIAWHFRKNKDNKTIERDREEKGHLSMIATNIARASSNIVIFIMRKSHRNIHCCEGLPCVLLRH